MELELIISRDVNVTPMGNRIKIKKKNLEKMGCGGGVTTHVLDQSKMEDAGREFLRKKEAGEVDGGTVIYSKETSPAKKEKSSPSSNTAASILPKKYVKGAQSLLVFVILGLACVVAFASRLFAVIRFESIIHEFDPW